MSAPGGEVLTRSPRSPETLYSFFPDWQELSYVPEKYIAKFTVTGEHHLPKVGIFTKVDHVVGDDSIERFCVEIRRALPRDVLSCKEAEIAKYLMNGLSTKEIAALLGKSPNTVRNQISSIYMKTGIRSRAELGAKFGALPPSQA